MQDITEEDLSQARQDQKYFLLSSGYFFPITIAAASIYWARNPAIIFDPVSRLAGEKEDLLSFLRERGYKSLGSKVITFASKDKFLADYSLYLSWYSRAWEKASREGGFRLSEAQFAANGNGPRISLLSRLQDLDEGRVLDVSLLRSDGTGARAIKIPSEKSKKYGFPSLPLVSSDLEHYLLALSFLPGDYTEASEYMRTLFGSRSREIVSAPIQQNPLLAASIFNEGLDANLQPDVIYTRAYPQGSHQQREKLRKKQEELGINFPSSAPPKRLRKANPVIDSLAKKAPIIPTEGSSRPSVNFDLRQREQQLQSNTYRLSSSSRDYKNISTGVALDEGDIDKDEEVNDDLYHLEEN